MRIINVCTFPPPIGGVSVFTKRLKEYLDSVEIENYFYDISGINYESKSKMGIICKKPFKAFFSLLLAKKSIVLFHSHRLPVFLAAFILRFRHKTLIVLHGESFFNKLAMCNTFKRQIILFSLRLVDGYIFSAKNIADKFFKISDIKPEICFYLTSIIDSTEAYPIVNDKVFTLRNECEFIILFYQWRWNIHNGELLYGADLVIELFLKLNAQGIDSGLIFICPDHEDNKHFRAIQTKLTNNNLENKIVFIFEPMEDLGEFYEISDIHIRATNSDAEALTVYESIFRGTPVIASDCVPRAEGSILFQNRDAESLYEVTKDVLMNLDDYKERLKLKRLSQQNMNVFLSYLERIYNE